MSWKLPELTDYLDVTSDGPDPSKLGCLVSQQERPKKTAVAFSWAHLVAALEVLP